jgi:hypothetical protein
MGTSATGAVHQALGASGNGAHPVILVNDAGTTTGAAFFPDTMARMHLRKMCINSREKSLLRISLGQKLRSYPTGHGNDRIKIIDFIF